MIKNQRENENEGMMIKNQTFGRDPTSEVDESSSIVSGAMLMTDLLFVHRMRQNAARSLFVFSLSHVVRKGERVSMSETR